MCRRRKYIKKPPSWLPSQFSETMAAHCKEYKNESTAGADASVKHKDMKLLDLDLAIA